MVTQTVDSFSDPMYGVSVLPKGPVYDRLRELKDSQRHAPRYTVKWLAEQIKVDHTALYRWLSGRWPMPPLRRQQIALLLQMDVEDVRAGSGGLDEEDEQVA